MDKNFEEIYDIYSVSSSEKNIKNYLLKEYQKNGYKICEDRLYSVFMNKENKNKKKLMIAFPLDEMGLMIENIEEDGKIRFIFLEDISPLSFVNQRVNIITRDYQNIKGIVCVDEKLAEKNKKDIKVEDLYIKAICSEEKMKNSIKIGDLISLESDLYQNDDFIVGRSLSQKIFQYLSIKLAEKLKDKNYPFDLYIGGIAQSTIGFRGTKTATYVIKPDVAIALTSFEVNNSNPKIDLEDGVVLGYYDKQMLPDKKLLNYIKDNFDTKPYLGFRGNDGSFIHKTLQGTPTVSLGIAVKNISTANEMLSINDYKKLEEFIIKFLDKFNLFLGE